MMDEYTKEKVLERVENKENNYEKTEINKTIIYVKRNTDGLLHCEDGPAYYELYNCVLFRHDLKIVYYVNGKIHREKEPAMLNLTWDRITDLAYFKNNLVHREDGPAIITRLYEEYMYEGKYHRTDGPSRIFYFGYSGEKRNPRYCIYYINGKKHREDGPAKIYWNKDGTVEKIKWYENDKKIIKTGLNTKSARN